MSLCLLVLPGLPRLQAQDFVLTLTNTPSPIILGTNLLYSLSVSNATGFNLNPGVITSEYDLNAELVRATNQFDIVTNTPGLVEFVIPTNSFPVDGVIRVFLELRGTNAGLVTNRFTVTIDDGGQTTPASTSVVSRVLAEGDLGVSVLGPANGVFSGDTFTYQLLATYAGAHSAEGVVVSNPLPANVSFVSLSPSNQVVLTNGVVLFSAGTLTNQGSALASVSVLATNAAATNPISATISAPFVIDIDETNNTTTANVPIVEPNTNQILVIPVSAQQFNPQTGWIEQRVRLVNVSTSSVDSVRLLVDGLTNHLVRLVNAAGTNWSTPYVAHGDGLAGGAEIELILEYFSPTRSTNGPNPAWSAHGTPPLDLTPRDGTGITVDRIVRIDYTNAPNLNSGRILLEWPAASDAVYQVIYDSQVPFTNARGSLPLVVTPSLANRVQWLDYGPPRTLAAPSNTAARFYRVIQLP